MIQVKNLTKTFDGFKALDSLNLHVPKGAVYGLVGPNGSGKSTVIRHILGSYIPDEGTVEVAGQPVWENPGVKAIMGNIPDDFYFPISADMNEMKKHYQSFYPAFDGQRFEKLAEIFTSIDRKKPIRSFSKGMQKQAAFWLVMSCRPQVLILDEPVDGLDPVMRRQVWSILLSDVAENGTTVLVSSHNLRELEDVCDHVGILYKGRMLLERSLDELQNNIVKVQIAMGPDQELEPLSQEFTLLYQTTLGRVHTLIVRGEQEKIRQTLAARNPVVLDLLPLSLEEIFIYELGGQDDGIKEILV